MNSNLEGTEEKGFFERVKESIEHFWTGDKDESKETNEKVANKVEAPAISPEAEKPVVKHKVSVVQNTTKTGHKTSPTKAINKKKTADKAVKANTAPTPAKVNATSATTINKRKTADKAVKANTTSTPAKVKSAPAKAKKAKTS